MTDDKNIRKHLDNILYTEFLALRSGDNGSEVLESMAAGILREFDLEFASKQDELRHVWNGRWSTDETANIARQVSDLLMDSYFAGRDNARAEYREDLMKHKGIVDDLRKALADGT